MVHLRHARRAVVVLAALGAPAVAMSCASAANEGRAMSPREAPRLAVDSLPAGAPAPSVGAGAGEVASDALSTFSSRQELIEFLRENGALRPDAPTGSSEWGGMWGDAVGDSFGAGGLGLSGAGLAQSFGVIGLLSTPETPESITNTQHVGVDEGGIVKAHGEHLVVLRRGRLFTVRIGDLSRVSMVDAFGPGVDPAGAWYDELLVANGRIVVVGYSYARGGTEIGLFDIDADGQITPRSTYHLRSNDYFSSRNYASRLIGDKLVFYTPLYVSGSEKAPLGWMPAVRRWRVGVGEADWRATAEPTTIVRPLARDHARAGGLALHTVTTCDLSAGGAAGEMSCRARAVMGPPGRVFYVSPRAVYVWMTPRDERTEASHAQAAAPASLLYRLPLDEGAPAEVLRTRGAPVDQFSFLERDGHINVLVRTDASGDAMWAPERSSGAVAMMRVPLARFSRRNAVVPADAYVSLPTPRGATFHNRFVGASLVYGTGSGWGYPSVSADTNAYVHVVGGGTEATTPIRLAHGVDRIEAMGDDAVVIGAGARDLHFSAVALDGTRPRLVSTYRQTGAAQGETRSQGFYYRSDGERSGVVALPIRAGGEPGYAQLGRGSASVLFLRHSGLQLAAAGALSASAAPARLDDGCRASCVDWYGNARPVFVRGRVLALLGYELVEGQLDGVRLAERRRASFAP